MKFIQILYAEEQHDQIFTRLKQLFEGDCKSATVYELVPNELMKMTWTTEQDPTDVAMELTKTIDNIVVEIPSNNNIDLYSRFFNGTQLW